MNALGATSALLLTVFAVLGSSISANAQTPPALPGRTWHYPLSARAPSTWTLESRPVVVLGGAEADDKSTFADVIGVVLLDGGLIAVGDSRANEVRVFTGAGVFLRSFGRRGQGPGEFDRSLWSLHGSGSTILATDNSGRVQLFSASGDVPSSRARPAPVGITEPERVGLLRGQIVAVAGSEYPKTSGEDSLVVLSVVLREVPDATGYRYERVASSPTVIRRSTTSAVFGPTHAITAQGDRLCLGHSSEYRITCFDAAGTPAYRITRSPTQTPITADQRAFARSAYIDGNRAPGLSREHMQRVEADAQRLRFADHAPAFGKMMLSSGGDLWVSEFDASARVIGPKVARVPRQPVTWRVYGSTGEWRAVITLPARFVPHVVTDTLVAGVSLDDDGVESVQVWRINKAR